MALRGGRKAALVVLLLVGSTVTSLQRNTCRRTVNKRRSGAFQAAKTTWTETLGTKEALRCYSDDAKGQLQVGCATTADDATMTAAPAWCTDAGAASRFAVDVVKLAPFFDSEKVVVLGSSRRALLAIRLLSKLGVGVTAVAAKSDGAKRCREHGASSAFVAGELDDSETTEWHNSSILDFCGDAGKRARRGYVRMTSTAVVAALADGLGAASNAAQSTAPWGLEVTSAADSARAIERAREVLSEQPVVAPKGSFNPFMIALRSALGPFADEYAEANLWPRDAETSGRYGLDFLTLNDVPRDDDDDFVEAPTKGRYMEEARRAAKVLPTLTPVTLALTSRAELDALDEALVFVNAKYCMACRRLDAHFNRLSKLRHDKPLKLARIDATVHRALAEDLGINSTPTFIFVKDGQQTIFATESPSALKTQVLQFFAD